MASVFGKMRIQAARACMGVSLQEQTDTCIRSFNSTHVSHLTIPRCGNEFSTRNEFALRLQPFNSTATLYTQLHKPHFNKLRLKQTRLNQTQLNKPQLYIPQLYNPQLYNLQLKKPQLNNTQFVNPQHNTPRPLDGRLCLGL